MNDEEYREFLSFLFERYVRSRLPRLRRRLRHHMEDEVSHYLGELEQAASVLRFIDESCSDDEEVYRTFRLERLASAVSETGYGVEFCNRVLEEGGFLDAYEAHAPDILAGLQPGHLPAVDREILRDMGSRDAEAELRSLVLQVKAGRQRSERWPQERQARQLLHDAAQRIAETRTEFGKAQADQKGLAGEDVPKKSRRWFKGLGQIGQGAALSIANVALAVGALHFPVSPETQTWGAIASVTTGVGTILCGMGDLRNE